MKLDIARDAQKLATSDHYFSELILKIGLPRERYREPTLATLIHIIVSQQISLTAADAIWKKFNSEISDITVSYTHLTLPTKA